MTDNPMSFTVEVRESPAAVVLVAHGELDLVGAPQVADALPAEPDRPVVADLSGVTFMDSSGLRALLDLQNACRRGGQELTLARPSEAVVRVIELVDLTADFSFSEGVPAS